MSRYRGAAVLVATLFILIALGLALYFLVPRHDLGGVETRVIDTMVASMDGVLHRCGLPPGLRVGALEGTTWHGPAAVVFLVLLLLYLRRRDARH